jgi:hypothetical protein
MIQDLKRIFIIALSVKKKFNVNLTFTNAHFNSRWCTKQDTIASFGS